MRANWSTGSSQARQTADAIIINPAGYSFTSIAILDAIKAFEGPVMEVHISNIHARDEYHRHSKISSVATAVICRAWALRLHRRDAGAGADGEETLILFTSFRTVVAPNSAFCVEGCERQYCGGASTWPPSSAAACQPQRGS